MQTFSTAGLISKHLRLHPITNSGSWASQPDVRLKTRDPQHRLGAAADEVVRLEIQFDNADGALDDALGNTQLVFADTGIFGAFDLTRVDTLQYRVRRPLAPIHLRVNDFRFLKPHGRPKSLFTFGDDVPLSGRGLRRRPRPSDP